MAIQKEHPTGFYSRLLPFYERLDDGGFEQFCTDLLNLHPVILCQREGKVVARRIVAATRFLSGSPQKGADIRGDAEAGEVWFFQCKHTSSFVPSEVTKALDLAEKGLPHGHQFVLITTCGLSAEAQEIITQRPKWLWWDAGRLTTVTQLLQPREGAINLVHRFFGPSCAKEMFLCSDNPLLTWQEFFAEDLSTFRKHFHHRIPFVPWSGRLVELENFARSGLGRALVLSAAGGQGKSRLLLQLAQNLEQTSAATRVRFLNLRSGGFSKDQTDFLAREEGHLLLIIDDAHRLGDTIDQVAKATAQKESVRLIIATRPQALETVTSQLYRSGYTDGRLEPPIRLPRWKSEEMQVLAERVLESQFRLQASRLAQLADRCPLLVVIGGELINSGASPDTMTNEETFRHKVFESFKRDFLLQQPEDRRERLDRLIRVLSFVSPAPKRDSLLEHAAAVIECTALDVGEDMEALQAAGLLAENREGLRLYPDLFADAVLIGASVDAEGHPTTLCNRILERLSLKDFPALMRNLAQADWELKARGHVKAGLFEPVWKEFVARFREGIWLDSKEDFHRWVLDKYAEGGPKIDRPNRFELLSDWASFAIFLPNETLELAELALNSVESASAETALAEVRARVVDALPQLLKPIAAWHPAHAERALELLWSLEAEEPRGDFERGSNAISAIAEIGSFAVHKPIAVSSATLAWLEKRLLDATGVERVRKQPWILSALLSPFFGRVVEHRSSTAKAVTISTLTVNVGITRELRKRALALVKEFASSGDEKLARAAIPVLKEAISPIESRFGFAPAEELYADWRPDRLEAISIIDSIIAAGRYSHVLLFQIRKLLRNRAEYDQDPTIRKVCEDLQRAIPDTMELRLARALTSWAHDEIKASPEPESDSRYQAIEREWAEFQGSVARELAECFPTAKMACDHIRAQIVELRAAEFSFAGSGGTLLQALAELSPEWCADLLKEILSSDDPVLDGFLWPVLQRAGNVSKDSYLEAVRALPTRGRPEQLCSLVNFLGWKQLHGGGLDALERESLVEATRRAESTVVYSLATICGLHLETQPGWAMEILSQLKPSGESDAGAILTALARQAEKHSATLEPALVARCLSNVGRFCFPESLSDEQSLEQIAERFPKQVYEAIRALHQQAEADPEKRWCRAETISLGAGLEAGFIDTEIATYWGKAVAAEAGSFAKNSGLALVRSLVWSQPAEAPKRLRKLAEGCGTGHELELVAEIVATPGSRFVFQFPDLVKLLLLRAGQLAVLADVRQTLWTSACGGGRSFTDHELDPEYRYILEQGEAMANRYKGDAHLEKFYRMVADSERKQIEWHKQAFANDDSD